jgi:hypothetical protein
MTVAFPDVQHPHDRRVIRESKEIAPNAWRRCLSFFRDGLRAEAAHPLRDEQLLC